jgi:hypothetical protein
VLPGTRSGDGSKMWQRMGGKMCRTRREAPAVSRSIRATVATVQHQIGQRLACWRTDSQHDSQCVIPPSTYLLQKRIVGTASRNSLDSHPPYSISCVRPAIAGRMTGDTYSNGPIRPRRPANEDIVLTCRALPCPASGVLNRARRYEWIWSIGIAAPQHSVHRGRLRPQIGIVTTMSSGKG